MAGAMACGSSCLSRRPTSCPLPISGVDSPCHRGRSRERQFLSYGPRCAPGNAVICVVLVYLRCSVGGSRWLPAFGQRCFKQRRAEGRRSSCTVREDAREVSRGVSANAAFDGRRSSARALSRFRGRTVHTAARSPASVRYRVLAPDVPPETLSVLLFR